MSRPQGPGQLPPIDYPENPPPQQDLKAAIRSQIRRRYQADVESLNRQRLALTLYYQSQLAAVEAIADDLEVIEDNEVSLTEDSIEIPTSLYPEEPPPSPRPRRATRSAPMDNGMNEFQQEDLGLGPTDTDPEEEEPREPSLDDFAEMEGEDGDSPRLRDVLPQRRSHASRRDLADMSEEELQQYQAQLRGKSVV